MICTFKGNVAQTGGVLFSRDNTAARSGVIFSRDNTDVDNNDILLINNSASQGVMYFTYSSATFTGNNVIINNSGSLLFYYSSVVFKGNTTIANNLPYTTQFTTISSEGGGITAFQSTVDFKEIVNLKRNSAINGGAISSVSSKLNVRGNLSLLQNIATDSGGGIYLYHSVLICKGLSILTLLGNNATDRGGGIHAIGSTITSQHSVHLKSVNESVYSGSLLFLTRNVAMNFGGGICFENNANSKS